VIARQERGRSSSVPELPDNFGSPKNLRLGDSEPGDPPELPPPRSRRPGLTRVEAEGRNLRAAGAGEVAPRPERGSAPNIVSQQLVVSDSYPDDL